MEHTAKNILIRAVKRDARGRTKEKANAPSKSAAEEAKALTDALHAEPVLRKLVQNARGI